MTDSRLFESAEIATFTPEERIKYQNDMTTERDRYNQLVFAEAKGREQGREKVVSKVVSKAVRKVVKTQSAKCLSNCVRGVCPRLK